MQGTETITSADDMYFYFEMLGQLQPHRVLDIGMFLKRIGAVSRQAMSARIPKEIFLYGVDFFSEIELPIYENVYNEILPQKEFFRKMKTFVGPNEKFDVVVLLRIKEYLSDLEFMQLAKVICQLARGVLADEHAGKRLLEYGMVKTYQPLSVGESRYCWIPLMEAGGNA